MRGRRPVGPEIAGKMVGSERARQRVTVILETVAGTLRIQDACEELGICGQLFERLRTTAIQAAVTSLEPRPSGRKPRPADPIDPEEFARLQARIVELEAAVQAATIRAELAAALPRIGGETGKARPRAKSPRPGTPRR